MQTSLRGIATKAKKNKKHKFCDLYRLLNEQNLIDSWKFMNRRAATGVDRMSATEYEKNLQQNIENLVLRLKKKTYRAKLIRRVFIPKSDGTERPLGIPAIEDKLVQTVVARILSAIFEQDFFDNSYGYRPNTSASKAVKDLTLKLQWGKYNYILDADIKGFFNNINHDWLIKMLEQRVNDKAFIRLIVKWLKAGILNKSGEVISPLTGTPQGGIVSPILANIYLHYELDLWFEKVIKPKCNGELYLCRYADDFICMFRYRKEVYWFRKELKVRLQKFSLELSEKKTKVIKFTRYRKQDNANFDFLGFEFRWGVNRKGKDIIKRRTSRLKFRNSLNNFKEWCRASRNFRLQKLFDLLNSKLRGYYNYYGVIGNYKSIREFFELAMKTLYKWLNRRSQRKSFNYKGFAEVLKCYKVVKPKIIEKRQIQLKLCFS